VDAKVAWKTTEKEIKYEILC